MTPRRAARTRRNPGTTSELNEARDPHVAADILWAGFLTTGQITRLRFSSKRRAQRRLRVLLDHGFVRAHLQGDALDREQIYTVTEAGIEMLLSRNLLEPGEYRPGKLPRPQRLAHALLARHVFVECVLAEREGLLDRVEVRFDEDLAAEPLYRSARLIPDAVVGLARGGRVVQLGVEVDRATETVAVLASKCRRYAALLDAARKGADVPTVLLFVAEGARRRETLMRIAREHLPHAPVFVLGPEEVGERLRAGWPHDAGAPPGRTEAPHAGGFRPVAPEASGGFRALGVDARATRS